MGDMKGTSKAPLAALGAFLLCLPCLAVLGVFGAGAVGFAAIGAWFSDNALVLGGAAAAALVAGALGGLMYVKRARGAACEVDPTKEHLGTVPQRPRQFPAPRESITPGAKERVSR